MKRVITKYEGISYTHRLLWRIAEEQAGLAREREREWVNFSIVSVTFAFHAVEAYVNFAGEHLAPDWWADERNSFRKEPYRGWRGKLRKVLELTTGPWEDTARPLKTVLELQDMRDSIAHGRAERFSDTAIHDGPMDDSFPWMPNPRIRAMVCPKGRVDVVLADSKALLERMHPAVAAVVNDPFFKASAVGGPDAWTSWSKTVE